MKKFIAVLGCILISACCIFAVSCAGGNAQNKNAFVFLSVRMKGNGDGTISAVAQNEFAIGPSALPVTISLYSSEVYETDVQKMTSVESISTEDLDIFKKITIAAEVKAQGYYCARITYTVGGDEKFIQSDTVLYGEDGKRIK